MPIKIWDALAGQWTTQATSLPGPTDPPPVLTGYPNAFNTGIAGRGLTPANLTGFNPPEYGAFGVGWDSFNRRIFEVAQYRGTDRTRIDSGNVNITQSLFLGMVDADQLTATLTLTDCTVDGMASILGVGFQNITLIRCNVYNALQCINIARGNVFMQDCYIHDPYLPPTDAHINPFFCGRVGADKSVVIKHCTFSAPIEDNSYTGGVSTNLSFFADYGPICNVTVEDCFFGWTGGAYAATFGWNPGKPFQNDPMNGVNIVVRNNVFERGHYGTGGKYGPVTACPIGRPGFVWENNRFEDGTSIIPTI